MAKFSEDFYARIRLDTSALQSDLQEATKKITTPVTTDLQGIKAKEGISANQLIIDKEIVATQAQMVATNNADLASERAKEASLGRQVALNKAIQSESSRQTPPISLKDEGLTEQELMRRLNLQRNLVKYGLLPYNNAIQQQKELISQVKERTADFDQKMLRHQKQLQVVTNHWRTWAEQISHAMGKMFLWGAAASVIYGTMSSIRGLIESGRNWLDELEDINSSMGGTIEQQQEFIFMAKTMKVEAASLTKIVATLRDKMSTRAGKGVIANVLGEKPQNLKAEFNDTFLLLSRISEAAQKSGDAGKFLKSLFGMKGFEMAKVLMLSPEELRSIREGYRSLGITLDKEGYDKLQKLQHEIDMTNAQMSLMGLQIYRGLQPALVFLGKTTLETTRLFSNLGNAIAGFFTRDISGWMKWFSEGIGKSNVNEEIFKLNQRLKYLKTQKETLQISKEIESIESRISVLRGNKKPVTPPAGDNLGMFTMPAARQPQNFDNLKGYTELLEKYKSKVQEVDIIITQHGLSFEGSLHQYSLANDILPQLTKKYKELQDALANGEHVKMYNEEIAKIVKQYPQFTKEVDKQVNSYNEMIVARDKLKDSMNKEESILGALGDQMKDENNEHKVKLRVLQNVLQVIDDSIKKYEKLKSGVSDVGNEVKNTTKDIREFSDAIESLILKLVAGRSGLSDFFTMASKFTDLPDLARTATRASLIYEAYGGNAGGTPAMGATAGGLAGGAIGTALLPGIGGQAGEVVGSFLGSLFSAGDDMNKFRESVVAVENSLEEWDTAMRLHTNNLDDLSEKQAYYSKQVADAQKAVEGTSDIYDRIVTDVFGIKITWAQWENSEKKAIHEQAIKLLEDAQKELTYYTSTYSVVQDQLATIEHNANMKAEEESERYKLEQYNKLLSQYGSQLDKETKWMLEENIWRIEQNININADVQDVRDIETLSRQIVERVTLYQSARYSTMPFGRF